jgi:two-component system response regulator NreC
MQHKQSIYSSPNTLRQLLSHRENQILPLIVSGQRDKEVALKLGISVNTVRAHRHNILIKTGRLDVRELIYSGLCD